MSDWLDTHFCINCGEIRVLTDTNLCNVCNAYAVGTPQESSLVDKINSATSIEEALKAVNELAKLKKKG